MTKRIIHIFKNDLRLSDNPSLTEASKAGHIIPIYIVDETDLHTDSAQNWWLQKSLEKLKKSLDNNLYFFKGNYKDIITSIISENDIQGVYWNRSYDPYSIQRDKDLKLYLEENNIEVKTFNSLLLWEPWQVAKPDGSPYRVFSPFYRKGCLNQKEPRFPLPQPNQINYFKINGSKDIKSLNLINGFNWYDKLNEHWDIGEKAAQKKLSLFLEDGIDDYKDGRNFPSKKNVSRLSPHIRFGEISPNQIWYAARSLKEDRNIDHFCSELGWREFSYYLLYHFPFIEKENLNKKFDNFPWTNNLEYLQAWQKGSTGYPIIDAGMRELWETGYMHNRVRMVVGSFLVKNLLIHWHYGHAWFNNCLVDADKANNTAGWQWIAGSGADAAPYFRIFNPITQGQNFDEDGIYTKKWIPELSKLPNKYLFNPWEASSDILNEADLELGKDYPLPIVDIKESRSIALKAFETIKNKS
jgi:deoxyribodipyrimidine photo-lyase